MYTFSKQTPFCHTTTQLMVGRFTHYRDRTILDLMKNKKQKHFRRAYGLRSLAMFYSITCSTFYMRIWIKLFEIYTDSSIEYISAYIEYILI